MEYLAKIADDARNLSHQLPRALLAGKDELFGIMQEPDTDLLLAALRNPVLDEGHLLALLKRRGLPEELFQAIYANKKLLENNRVKYDFVRHADVPLHIAQTILPQLHLFELAKICQLPGINTDLKLAAERAIIQRLPTQPLGNKLTLARQGSSAIVEMLIREGQPQVVEACLDNPHLKEGAVYQFITSFHANADTISMVARHARWKGRPNIRFAILKNPRTPLVWFTSFLPTMLPQQLRDLLAMPKLAAAQKDLVRKALNDKGKHH